MKIKVIIPNSNMDRITLNSREHMLSRVLSSDTSISVDCIESGPASIESHYDEILASIPLIKQSIKAEKDGFNAIVIYCFSDVAIEAIREKVSIPVIGPGEVSMAFADMNSNKFTVITTIDDNITRTRRRLMKNDIAVKKMASVRALNIPVVKLRENPEITKEYLWKVCEESLIEENIDAVLLGCLGLAQYGSDIKDKLGILVIDPAFIAVTYAEMCIKLELMENNKVESNNEGI